ncbi:MAG: MerR family transcriptional regulator [Alphaproteobacteria bacterium]|nr:MerR family transcriptional regulator [Alphaproteobacteria bacterium]
MSRSKQFLSPSEAAKRLGVSTKALRLYEQRGLLDPVRTEAGWRTYGPVEMAQAAEIVALRALGLSLAEVARVSNGDPQSLEPALAAHQKALEGRIRRLADTVEQVRGLRADLAREKAPKVSELARMVQPTPEIRIAIDLPWPWGGERFELRDIRALNYIIGPLFSGKTRLARTIAETLPDATFLGLERLTDEGAAARETLDRNPALKARVDKSLHWLIEDGATESAALRVLVVSLESENLGILIVDMVEDGLDQASQEALISYLRLRGPNARPLFLLTRSCAVLDLAAVGPDEAIILCPANHSPPAQVAPYPGAPGYEAVATCLATPEARARTEGVVAWRPEVA